MSKSVEMTIVPDDDIPRQQQTDHDEDGIDVPWDSINPDTLRNLIAEFVTRKWSDSEFSLDTKVEQVLKQIRTGQAKIVFDMISNTCNIVPSK
ncbi:MAG: YheU family protein [Desulfobulbus sp.]|nr:YheU family protein [Desulfobulbus sp.]